MDYLNWVRDINDTKDLSLEVKAKFDTCIDKILEWHLDRDNALYAEFVDKNFPSITGSHKDWVNWAMNHERYNITLERVRSECQKLANKRFDVKARFTPQQNRLQQNILIADSAKLYLHLVIRHREQQNMTDAQKWGLAMREERKKEVETLITEVSNDSKEDTEQKDTEQKIQIQVPRAGTADKIQT